MHRFLGMEEAVTEGYTVDELIKATNEGMQFNKIVSWDEFAEKDYVVIPISENWEDWSAGFYDFNNDPVGHPLPTPTGKLEFYSASLDKAFPNDEERPAYPQWIEKSITHDERISSTRAKLFPLLVLSNHGRWRVHAQADDMIVYASMPEFEYDYGIVMDDALISLGIPDAFDALGADFNKMGKSSQGNLFISRVIHKTYISVDKLGTKAGAVTMIPAADSAIEPSEHKTVHLNRPFVYAIIDNATNLPVFIGTLMTV